MALNIPMPDFSGDSLLKGLSTGGDLFHKMMLNKYYGQLQPTGDVANALYVQNLRNQFGENDPRYIEAKRAHDLQLQARQSLMDYRTQLSDLAPYKAATPEEKLIAAQSGRGVLQTHKSNPVNPDYSDEAYRYDQNTDDSFEGDDSPNINEQEARVYNQALAKRTTDAAIRNKIPYAENVKITMDSIDPDALVQFSGPKGSTRLGFETLKAAYGSPSKEFEDYQRALTGAQTLSKQLRQFWGDSIQPAALEKIEQLTNPSHWKKNPEIAKQQFLQLKDITERELANFTQHGTSPLKLSFDKKAGNFLASEKGSNKSALQSMIENYGPKKKLKDTDVNLAQSAAMQLSKILPKATAENIIATSITTGRPVSEVIAHLNAQAQSLNRGQ